MNLHKATLFLIFGSIYTVLHKMANAFFPSLGTSGPGRSITSALWLTATFALILFAYYFLKELAPRGKGIRYSLICIIVFTAGVILSKLPLGLMSDAGLGHRLLLGISGLFNSFAILIFLLSLARLVSKGTALWWPTRATILACILTSALGITSFGYFLAFLLTGQEIEPLPFLQPLSVLSFLFTYGTTIWFLVTFRHMGNYQAFAER
jgi:hypothetical protein